MKPKAKPASLQSPAKQIASFIAKFNPKMAKLIDSGEYDPVTDNRRLIAELRQRV